MDTGRFALENSPIWSNLKNGGVTLPSCLIIQNIPRLQEPKIVWFLVNSVPDMWISFKFIIRGIEYWRLLVTSCSLRVAPENAIRRRKERGLSLFPRGSSIGSQAILDHSSLLSESVSYVFQTSKNPVRFWPSRGGTPRLVLRSVRIRGLGDALEAEIPPSLQVKGFPLCTVWETCICLQKLQVVETWKSSSILGLTNQYLVIFAMNAVTLLKGILIG